MLFLLPPSEGKASPGGRRRPVDLTGLSFPELTGAREQVLDSLVTVSARPDAVDVLGVGPSLSAEVERNTRLRSLPTRRVADLYTGVLYDALDLPSLPEQARRGANRQVVVLSGLWGALRLGDAVPPYRLSMATTLPGRGPMATFWREHLAEPLAAAAGHGLVVDCRSTTYQAAWVPPRALAGRTVAIRVLREADGHRTVVSHMAKQTRGRVTRHLLAREGRPPRTVEHLVAAVAEEFTCEVTPPPRPGRGWTLDVVVREG